MKIKSWLKTSVFLTTALAASAALASDRWHPGSSATNATPKVRIIFPIEGTVYDPGQTIDIAAQVTFFTNPIVGVQFFAGTNSLGVVTNSLQWSDVYYLAVQKLDGGDYTLTAVATDTAGNTVTSSGVDISVLTNLPPKVRLVTPVDGATILGPTNILLTAAANDPDGTVASVEFFEGTNSLGIVPTPALAYVTNCFGVFTIKEPFTLTWSNVTAGTYTLTAVATDNDGATGTSKDVTITVVTNLPPVVHLVSPGNGATYRAPASVNLKAVASSPGGSIASVQFFAGSNSLGVVTTPVVITNFFRTQSYYSLTWSNAAAGTYALTAVATDNFGTTTTSSAENIHILPPPSPKVQITDPFNGESFHNAPLNINVGAFEQNFTNAVAQIQFFANGSSIGTATTSPFGAIVWSNVTAGAYSISAIATDTQSITATSAPVNITVTTNRTPGWWGH